MHPSDSLKREVANFYGGTCVCCDQSRPQLHHLNDAPKKSARFQDILPIHDALNMHAFRAATHGLTYLTEHSSPYYLGTTGFDLYNRGEFARAYGCNRMAAYLFEKLGDYEEAVKHLIYCVSDVRPIAHSVLVKDTAIRIACHFRKHNLPPNRKAQYLDQLANVCFDNGRFDDARIIFEMAARLYRAYFSRNPDCATSDINTTIKEALGRRKLAHLRGVKDIDDGLAMLQDDEELFRTHRNDEGRGCTFLSIACLHRHAGNTSRALEVLQENERCISLSSFWNRVEAGAALGDLLMEKRARSARGYLEQAHRLYKDKHILPWSVPIRGGVFSAQTDKSLTALGLKTFVQEHGTIPTRDGRFPFTSEQLKWCVGSVGT